MRRFWMIVLTMTLAASLGHAQQAADSEDIDNSSVQAPVMIVKKIIPPKMLNQQLIHISSADISDAEFTEEARAKKINGRCLISFTVDVNGMPRQIKPVRCTDPSFAKGSVASVTIYRFKPATTEDGDPVDYHESVVINYYREGCFDPVLPIRRVFSTPPGVISSAPGADGVYPLTKSVTSPAITRFSDEGYGVAAFNSPEGNGSCDIVLIISATGNASDPQVTHCERPELEKLAVQSFLKSQYKPGKVNGKAVPVRASIHIEYADIPPKS
jgi:Gram-negative bacterial TonB protein C-terminal